jgi:hypothetical protein
MINMNVLPFIIDNLYAGLGECRGLIKDEGQQLTLEVQLQDTVAGILKSGVQKFCVPISDVVSLTLTNGWLGTKWGVKLVLQTDDVELLSELPGATQGRVQLRVARKDVEAAELFVEDFHERPQHVS